MIGDEGDYTPGSADNPRTFDRAYVFDPRKERYYSSACSVTLRDGGGGGATSCVLVATGGATGIHEHSAVLHPTALFVAVGDTVAALALPSLDLLWSRTADPATCFGVYNAAPYRRCLITHGELTVTRLGYDGTVHWEAGWREIFTGPFVLVAGDEVQATDFDGRVVRISIKDGTLK